MANENNTGLLVAAVAAVGAFLFLTRDDSAQARGPMSFGFNPTVRIREQMADAGINDARENQQSEQGGQTAADSGGQPSRGDRTRRVIEASPLVSGSVDQKNTGAPPDVQDTNPPQSIFPGAVKEAADVTVEQDLTTPGGTVSSIEEDFNPF